MSSRRPLVILENAGASNLRGLGEHLASWGFIVAFDVAPIDLVDRLGDHNDCNASRAAAWVGVGRGGHIAWVDAGSDDEVDARAVVAIDPGPYVPYDGLFHSEQGPGEAHTLVLVPQTNACSAAVEPVEPGRSHPGTYVRVAGGHCDVQGPDGAECENACGASTPSGRAVSRRITTAWLLVHVADEPWANAWLPPAFREGVKSVDHVARPSSNPWTMNVQPSLLLGSTLHTRDPHSDLTFGLRVHFPWAREPERVFGIGPYADVMGVGGDFDVGAGASARVSCAHTIGITPSAGVYARSSTSWEAGLTAGFRVDVEGGIRLGNSKARGPLVGIVADGRFGLGPFRERSVFVGADVDALELLRIALLPFLLPYFAQAGD